MLIELWRRKGAGTIFETEDILSPAESHERAEWHAQKRPERSGVLFYEGTFGLGFIQSDGAVITVDGRGGEHHSPNLACGYLALLRSEFSQRYGLLDAPGRLAP